jgi:hypothetical protein
MILSLSILKAKLLNTTEILLSAIARAAHTVTELGTQEFFQVASIETFLEQIRLTPNFRNALAEITRGVTGEKALEIQQIWPTPRHLVDAYLALEPKERENSVPKNFSK